MPTVLPCSLMVTCLFPAVALKAWRNEFAVGLRFHCDQQLKMLCVVTKLQMHHKWKIAVCNDASHKSLKHMTLDELWEEVELKYRGGASHNQSKCVCVFFYKVWLCYMNLLRSYASFCYRPLHLFCQLARTVNQLSFGSWPTFPLNLVQVCESIWKLCTFLQ